MNNKKEFCEECREYVNVTITEIEKEGYIKDEKYSYIGKEAYCNDCDSEIYTHEINDFNLKSLYDVYRQKNNIVSHNIILEIPNKYSIGKRPLSLLLGWGEQTFSRYYDGDIPTKQYSEITQKIYDDPAYYAEILENNKDNLKNISSYKKTKRAVDDLLGNFIET
jgi:hypothetical protein